MTACRSFHIVIASAFVLMGSTAAYAATIEETAVAAGRLEGSYNRARFLCLAAGIPMVTYAERQPGLVDTVADMKARHPDFFALGAENGFELANRTLSGTPDDLRRGCALFTQPSGRKQ